METRDNKLKAVVVHANNAIFFGYLREVTNDGKTVSLFDARNAYYWKCSTGMLELSSTGPKAGSKIGERADITLNNVVMIQECKEEAVDAWEKAIWSR